VRATTLEVEKRGLLKSQQTLRPESSLQSWDTLRGELKRLPFESQKRWVKSLRTEEADHEG
jgi:hypothetical protein